MNPYIKRWLQGAFVGASLALLVVAMGALFVQVLEVFEYLRAEFGSIVAVTALLVFVFSVFLGTVHAIAGAD